MTLEGLQGDTGEGWGGFYPAFAQRLPAFSYGEFFCLPRPVVCIISCLCLFSFIGSGWMGHCSKERMCLGMEILSEAGLGDV